MPFAIPLVGKIIAGLATSEATAAGPTAPKLDTDKTAEAPDAASFGQTLDDLSRAAAASAAQQALLAGRS